MATIKIDDGLLTKVKKIIKNNHIDYPSVKSFVDKAVKERLEQK